MRKGFTLIELLAVIVILAIIALIATPIVLKIINNTKSGAIIRSAANYINAVEQSIAKENLHGKFDPIKCVKEESNDDLTCTVEGGTTKKLTVKVNGESPKTATLAIEKGKVVAQNDEGEETSLVINETTIQLDEQGNPAKVDSTVVYKCKRAKTLHTQECLAGATCINYGYEENSTVTYGNLKTRRELLAGDAFDCDVDGNGEYNSETERFYYVSDYYNTTTNEFDDEVATLIYYSSVSGGLPISDASFYYSSGIDNKYGPIIAVEQLPTTTQWPNVSLVQETKTIVDQNNLAKAGVFSYSGRAARLLTFQELTQNCGLLPANWNTDGILSNCDFLFENTYYTNTAHKGYWLENIVADSKYYAWYMEIPRVSVGLKYPKYPGREGTGVRPVIDVPIDDIQL